MPDQNALLDDTPQRTHTPVAHSLWTAYVDGQAINHAAWVAAVAGGEFVGNCGDCGDMLVPAAPYHAGKRTDYEAHCRSEVRSYMVDGARVVDGCGATLNAPGGRLGELHRPSRPRGM